MSLILSSLSALNAFYTFYRKRHYRLFEQPIETTPSTPSAQRVRVDSSPMSSSPLRFLQNLLTNPAESRAYPDPARDVWEISVWDPNPLCLQLFCLFSPGHVLIYSLFLPVDTNDPRPSVRVVTTLVVACLLSIQLLFLRNSFSQQTKDSAIIHKEVLNEYDIKFVHPLVQRPVRDVGIQTPPSTRRTSRDAGTGPVSEVDVYTPMTIINRGFRTHPNPSYASQYDPDGVLTKPAPRSTMKTPSIRPHANTHFPTHSAATTTTTDFSSPIRQTGPLRQPQFRHAQVGTGGDGGSLGVYSHAASPLRKAASTNFLRDDKERRRDLSPMKREGSPLKRMSTPSGFVAGAERDRVGGVEGRFKKSYSGLGVGRRESGRF